MIKEVKKTRNLKVIEQSGYRYPGIGIAGSVHSGIRLWEE